MRIHLRLDEADDDVIVLARRQKLANPQFHVPRPVDPPRRQTTL